MTIGFLLGYYTQYDICYHKYRNKTDLCRLPVSQN